MKRMFLDFHFYRWILVCGLFVEMLDAFLQLGQDCRTLEQGPYYFKRIDDYTYQCVKDGPLYTCPRHWSIPDWYVYDDTEPCMCQDVKSQGRRVCPQDPMLGYKTTEDPIYSPPVLGTINDNGCPSPFQKYEGTLRIYNKTDAVEFELSKSMGFLTPEDECKYQCMSVGPCTGITYSIQNGDPVCVGFFTKPNNYDFRGSDFHMYAEKVWCINDVAPVRPTPPPIQNGLLQQNTKQVAAKVYAFLKGVSELSCYSWCYYEPSCAAVNYNKHTHECFYFTETSCDAQEPALDHHWNHYKKKYRKC